MNIQPDLFSIIFSFIFGTLIGSFLNVVAIRYNTGFGIGGRSKCMSCGKTLTWKELIPVFSFLYQKGACKKCKSKISWQYPLVEFTSGILFLLIFITYPPVTGIAALYTAFYLFITALLVVINVYDIKHKIIPDSFVYTFAAVALFKLILVTYLLQGAAGFTTMAFISTAIAGPALALPFALIWLGSRGKWMGLGDAKIILGIGWTLGLSGGLSAVILAFWIGAVLSLAWLFIVVKKFKMNYEIPFAPFLILGMYLVLIFGIHVIDIQGFL